MVRHAGQALALVVLSGCGAPHDPSSAGPSAREVWTARCGECHQKVEPGAHDRAYLTAAMQRHRTRMKLPERKWAELVEFLAPPEGAR